MAVHVRVGVNVRVGVMVDVFVGVNVGSGTGVGTMICGRPASEAAIASMIGGSAAPLMAK